VASPSTVIRPATEADGPAIRGLVREAQLNPRDLDWRRFLVADDAGTVVACAQVRVHGRGTRELASVAVRRDRRGEGIGRQVSEATIAREPVRPLYLYTEASTIAYWNRFAFTRIEGDDLPPDLRGPYRLARFLVGLFSVLTLHRYRIVVMRREEP
jgi:N-acetylglutamate synthase-like GNAT family acetyltransferase